MTMMISKCKKEDVHAKKQTERERKYGYETARFGYTLYIISTKVLGTS